MSHPENEMAYLLNSPRLPKRRGRSGVRLHAPSHGSRVAELQANAAVSTVVTIEELTIELEQARQLAMARGNASAAVMAVIAKAKWRSCGVTAGKGR